VTEAKQAAAKAEGDVTEWKNLWLNAPENSEKQTFFSEYKAAQQRLEAAQQRLEAAREFQRELMRQTFRPPTEPTKQVFFSLFLSIQKLFLTFFFNFRSLVLRKKLWIYSEKPYYIPLFRLRLRQPLPRRRHPLFRPRLLLHRFSIAKWLQTVFGCVFKR
jgi:hypothetical protein